MTLIIKILQFKCLTNNDNCLSLQLLCKCGAAMFVIYSTIDCISPSKASFHQLYVTYLFYFRVYLAMFVTSNCSVTQLIHQVPKEIGVSRVNLRL